MDKVVAQLLKKCPGGKPKYLAKTGWLDDVPRKERNAFQRQHTQIFLQQLAELTSLLGQPDQPDDADAPPVAAWYPEAIRAACWKKDGKTVCLSLEQHDQETPIAVVLQCLSDDEIAELGG